MAKITLTDITVGHAATTAINANNDAIEAAFENTLSRDGTAPNTMNATLDMNSQNIVNLPDGTANQHPATIAQLNALSLSGGGGADYLINLLDVATSTATDGNILQADGTDWHSVPLGDLGLTAPDIAWEDLAGNLQDIVDLVNDTTTGVAATASGR